jgi:hypothetical protein
MQSANLNASNINGGGPAAEGGVDGSDLIPKNRLDLYKVAQYNHFFNGKNPIYISNVH